MALSLRHLVDLVLIAQRPVPLPNAKPRISSTASNPPATEGGEVAEVIELTRALYRQVSMPRAAACLWMQAQLIIRNSTLDDIQDSVRLLVTDTEQLIGSAR